ncbi:S8 family serine peptidase [Streptomyces virginiae]|uniref:S8 family serine peptidase n=1 Tax=Streptomyces virginiae TaxID=1961 RepID=UPI0036AAEBA0
MRTESGVPWGLARMSHRLHLHFGNFNKCVFEEGAGEGVDVHILDTGINTWHVEFEGRDFSGRAMIGDADADDDADGRGTHLAGTVAGRKYGVAKWARVHSVKVAESRGCGGAQGCHQGSGVRAGRG